jgi:peptide deformylase
VTRPTRSTDRVPSVHCGVAVGAARADTLDPRHMSHDPEPAAGAEVAEDPYARLDPEVRARREAALRHVRKYGDPVLKTRAREIERFDAALRDEIERMGRLMNDALGVGLAATQVGILNRVLVYRVVSEGAIAALVNPVLEWSSRDEEPLDEGCLSLPGVLVEVDRPIHVRVRAQDEYGDPLLIEASGLEARVIQHEMDHLDGVLILERTSRDQRKQAMRTLREALAEEDARVA